MYANSNSRIFKACLRATPRPVFTTLLHVVYVVMKKNEENIGFIFSWPYLFEKRGYILSLVFALVPYVVTKNNF